VARIRVAALALFASVAALLSLVVAPSQAAAQQAGDSAAAGREQPRAQTQPGPRASVFTEFEGATHGPESGPFTYTISVRNDGNDPGEFVVECEDQPQLPCTDPDPAEFYLDPNETQVVTVGYQTLGLGTFSQVHRVTAGDLDPVDITAGPITVSGTPIQTHVKPQPGQITTPTDTLKAVFAHPSGVDSTTFRVFIDGSDSTSSVAAIITANSISLPVVRLLGGEHVFTSYGCAVTERCDSLSTSFQHTGPATTWEFDDSLPPIEGEGRFGTLPGALPLPPENLRGCQVNVGDPEIWLTSPFSFLLQPANDSTPAGYPRAQRGLMASLLWRIAPLTCVALCLSCVHRQQPSLSQATRRCPTKATIGQSAASSGAPPFAMS